MQPLLPVIFQTRKAGKVMKKSIFATNNPAVAEV